MTQAAGTSETRVLVVDDDNMLRSAYVRVLVKHGFDAIGLDNAESALELLLRGERFSCIVTDLRMPGLDGIGFLKRVRSFDLDVPLIVMTGDPSLETATEAVRYGGFRYLIKPVAPSDLVEGVRAAGAMHRLGLLKRQALEIYTSEGLSLGDQASLEVYYARAFDKIWMAFQPIVLGQERKTYGYEALVRSREPMLPHPGALFDAAKRLGQLHELGRRIRALVADRIPSCPADAMVFVNLHPVDLEDPHLYDPSSPLTQHSERVVLEITERASLHDLTDVTAKVAALRALGFRIAVDDLGAGYAGLASLSQLWPDVVKLDMALIRGIDKEPKTQSIVRSMISVCEHDLQIDVVSEGVETEGECTTLGALGGRLFQGFLFGKPDPNFIDPFR